MEVASSIQPSHCSLFLKTKFLHKFLKEKTSMRRAFDEVFQPDLDAKEFKIDDDEELDEEDVFDYVCAICDNGGDLLCCQGRCMRSFHPTAISGAESSCESLGFSDDQVEAMQIFLCSNCRYKQHQCFACGNLGSSDKSSGAEVFPCVSATCGHFYHPECVAKLIHAGNENHVEELQKRIFAGQSFTCPIHKCFICKKGEDKEVVELQFAMCRRCPTAYHRKCLPREISFEVLEEENSEQRAWDGLLPSRILIYCLKHKIEKELGTPKRNHLIFYGFEEKKKSEKKDVSVKRSVASVDPAGDRIAANKQKQVSKVSNAIKDSDSTKKSEKHFYRLGVDSLKTPKIADASRSSLKDKMKSISMNVDKSLTARESSKSLRGEKFNLLRNKGSESVKRKQQELNNSKIGKPMTSKPVIRFFCSSSPVVSADTEKRISALREKFASSITSEMIKEKHRIPSTLAYSANNMVGNIITQGKVEVMVEAIRTALQKLEEGGSIEDAKAVCGPNILHQIIRWKEKLNIYIAPFLHGMRYTSFGRHFTKVDKLREIVDKLHWYIQNGDTIVDFCCGSNDFSWLLKEKLEETGKNCSFKNYDIIQPKNDFNFEKKDWMTVCPEDLPTGSQLIMGLNPPFGARAALANKFIDKALEFKPKLLILIVPKETQRLDAKDSYNLIWEDDEKLSGKSFYLPGSVDVNDKQMDQWNLKPPPLYLWSRSDWTDRHKVIAHNHGHISKESLKSSSQGSSHVRRHSGFSNVGSQSSIPYGYPGQAAESSCNWIRTPVMKEYVPGLDRMNYTRMNTSGPATPPVGPGSWPYFRANSMGFMPGPQHSSHLFSSATQQYVPQHEDLNRMSASGPRRGFHADSMGGFTPGSQPHFHYVSPGTQQVMPHPGMLNNTGLNTFGPERPLVGSSGISNPLGPNSGFHADSMEFMPGSQHPFPYQNTAG